MSTAIYPPGPKRILPGGHFLSFRRDPLAFLARLARDYGDVAHFTLGPQHVFFLNHPDHVRDVLVTRHDHFIKGRALQRAKRLLG
ncbi:MAG: cytochrome P450, partial [Pyrinomonadaceae bacterium]